WRCGGRMRQTPTGEAGGVLVARWSTHCDSRAEVYRLEAIETVFGSLQQLKPRTLSALVEQMRGNLGTVWRLPATQEQQKTKRKQQDIEQEVLRGYQVALAGVRAAPQKNARDSAPLLARAAGAPHQNHFPA